IETGLLWDGRFSRATHLPYGPEGRAAWIQIEFNRPQVMQSMRLGLRQPGNVSLRPAYIGAELQCSTDGTHFHRIALTYDSADDAPAGLRPVQETVTFARV